MIRLGAAAGVLLGVLCCGLALSGAEAGPEQSVAPRELQARDIAGRWRVFGKPGDYALENAAVTAVVRKRDGWLTDLWRNTLILPTADQLGTHTNVDALWQFYPVIRLGDTNVPVMARRVSRLPDAIEVDGVAETLGVKYRALTRYRLHASEPRISITTSFSVEGGQAAGGAGLGDAFKWGNVEYVVDGVTRPRLRFKGAARWIGRRGAGGDLVLRARTPERMHIEYEARIEGFQGEITALYSRTGIPKGETVSFSRELAFEPLPPAPASRQPTGVLELSITDEHGRPIAAKLRLDREGYPRPLFPPDGGIDGADRFVWTGNGRLRRELPVGRYSLLVTAGIERDAHRANVYVGKGKSVRVEARLPRVIATPGQVAADLHLHQAPSVDADVSLENRIIAIAAEGVEFAVATDHYAVTDLAPTLRWLEQRGLLTVPVQTMIGSEVSTVGFRFGHFNVFPLKLGAYIPYENTTPRALFDNARGASPRGVVQVNHPRLGKNLGYFEHFGVDKDTGEPVVRGYSENFDTIEVYNGDEAYQLKTVRKVLYDFIHVLGRGRRYAATGSSDSHKLAFLDPGLPRTLVRYSDAGNDASDPRAPAQQVIDAIKRGRSIVTSGPIIEASIDGKGPGETVSAGGRKLKLRVLVRAAPWIDVRAVEVLVGGRAERVHWVEVPRSRQVTRLDRTFDIAVTGNTFVIVTAQGERQLPNVSRDDTLPFAFTNPIWIEP